MNKDVYNINLTQAINIISREVNQENSSTDTLLLSIKRLYIEANTNHKNNNISVALELYNHFVNLAIAENYEKQLWKEIRNSYSYISTIAATLPDTEISILNLKKALEITLKYYSTDYENLFIFIFNIAKYYYNDNDYNHSLEYYHQAEAIFNSTKSLPLVNKALIYNNLALCYLKLGQDSESQYYINESNNINVQLSDFNNLAKNYNNKGLLLQDKLEYAQALVYFNRSVSIYDSLNNQERSAFVINNIGNLYLEKNSLDSSKYYYKKSLRIKENSSASNPIYLVNSYNNLAYVFLKLNNPDSALIFNTLAIDLNTHMLDKERRINYYSISDYLTSIADRIDINLFKYNITKEKEYLNLSYALFQSTIEIIIDQLVRYNSIITTNIFINENKRFFDSAMIASHLLDSLYNTKCPRSLIISEIYKSLSLLNYSSEIKNLQHDTISENQIGRMNNYYRWQESILSPKNKLSKYSKIQLIDSLITHTLDYDLFKQRFSSILNINIHQYFFSLSDSLLLSCNKLCDNMLIDYYISGYSLYIHTITKSGISCIVHPLNDNFFESIDKYPKSIRFLDQKAFENIGRILSLCLIDPIAQCIISHNNISIIPDERLTGIPFETLPFNKIGKAQSCYLISSKNISYQFTVLKRNYSNIKLNHNYSEDFFGIAPYELNDSSYHNLHGSVKEVLDIKDIFLNKGLIASSLIGKNATYNNMVVHRQLEAKILHFSTHSFINSKYSHLSFLELSPEENQYQLFLPVLSGLPFQNDLLLLNACETGSNLINSSTGFVSFIRSMSNVLIRNYIGTLWKIYDEPAYDFMIYFYTCVLDKQDYKYALNQAKRYFIDSNNYNSPIFWSPFILYENN